MVVTLQQRSTVILENNRGGWPVRGEWRAKKTAKPEGRRFAEVCCPSCSGVTIVGLAFYVIQGDGRVTPTFICEECSHKEDLRLNGWLNP